MGKTMTPNFEHADMIRLFLVIFKCTILSEDSFNFIERYKMALICTQIRGGDNIGSDELYRCDNSINDFNFLFKFRLHGSTLSNKLRKYFRSQVKVDSA